MSDTVTISGKKKDIGKGTIKVKVLNLCDNEPIENAEAQTSGHSAKSDKNGLATLKELPAGKHSVRVIKKYPEADYVTFLCHYPKATLSHKAESKTTIDVKLGKEETKKIETKLKVYRLVEKVVFKRKEIHPTGEDKYGHWWVEIDDNESYGWWPKYRVGLIDTLKGIEGELNGQTSFRGKPNRDPHHGDISAEGAYQPVIFDMRTTIEIEHAKPCNCRSDAEIKQCIRNFAGSYASKYGGRWSWRFETFGNDNCHTFQKEMMKHCRLENVKDLMKGK